MKPILVESQVDNGYIEVAIGDFYITARVCSYALDKKIAAVVAQDRVGLAQKMVVYRNGEFVSRWVMMSGSIDLLDYYKPKRNV